MADFSMDPIINAKFKNYRVKNNLQNIQDGFAFSKYVNYSILIGHQASAFNGDSELLEKINVDGIGDMGIDGLAIKIEGILIKNIEEVESIIKKMNRVDIEFIFIQSKYKTEFTKTDFSNFVIGVRDFLSSKPKIPHGEGIDELLEIKEYLMSDEMIIHWKNNPSVRLYYVTMAKNYESKTQEAIAKQFKEDILSFNQYKEPDIYFVNSDEFKAILDSNDNIFEHVINAQSILPLTKVNEVENSCIIICFADELKKLLKAPDGLIRKSLFDENVRDFQGKTNINRDINDTINKEPEKFILLNNGITIICDEFTQNNLSLNIKNPQIVNGCQTSHVIFNNSDNLLSKTPLVIKLISTKNSEITNQIVYGTNNQNLVPPEAFETTKRFHQELEDFINAVCENYDYNRIYYERRSKQYQHIPTILDYQKVNLKIILSSVVGMFLNCPHKAHKFELELLADDFPNQLFLPHQSKWPYFTAALAFYELESLFRENIIDKKAYDFNIQPFNIHILMIFKELIDGTKPDINNEEIIDKYCQKILSNLKNTQKRNELFIHSCQIFIGARNEWINRMGNPDYIKTSKKFLDFLLTKIGNNQQSVSVNKRKFGKIVHIGKDRYNKYYGYIDVGSFEDIFFHEDKSPGYTFRDNNLYSDVSYELDKDPIRGNDVAINIKDVPLLIKRSKFIIKTGT